eukprot:6542873-Prymnesium_polylepis.1
MWRARASPVAERSQVVDATKPHSPSVTGAGPVPRIVLSPTRAAVTGLRKLVPCYVARQAASPVAERRRVVDATSARRRTRRGHAGGGCYAARRGGECCRV